MTKIKHCFSFAGATLLAACATQAPAPTQAQTSGEQVAVPIGYQKVMVNGEVRYCRNNVDTGSHISSSRVCYTMAQLQAQSSETQDSISTQIQNSNTLGTAVGAGAPTGAR